MTIRKRIGVAKHTKVPVTWAVECPLHAGQKNLEYPVGKAPIGSSVDFSRVLFYCPSGSGHTFDVEDAKATIYNEDGTVAASGVALLDYLDF
jgi:hypothetical protein